MLASTDARHASIWQPLLGAGWTPGLDGLLLGYRSEKLDNDCLRGERGELLLWAGGGAWRQVPYGTIKYQVGLWAQAKHVAAPIASASAPAQPPHN